MESSYDVIVVGAGNAALCAALSASESGARVLVLESAPEAECGGNTRFTAGAMRVVYRGVEDLKALMPDLADEEVERTDFGSYTADQFLDDVGRVTQYRADPDLAEISSKKVSRPCSGCEARACASLQCMGVRLSKSKVASNSGGA